jgi:hypothetical protein
MQNSNNTERKKSGQRRLNWKQLKRRSSKSLRMRKKGEEQRRNILKTLGMNSISRSSKSKPERGREMNSRSERGTSKNYLPLKSIRGDLKRRDKRKRREWRMSSNANSWRSLQRMKDLSR